MKKLYKQAVTAISAVSLLATSCITGMSAKITDTNDFAVQYASSSGSHVATVGVKNSSDEARTFTLYTAIYDADNPQVLSEVSVAPHTIDAGKTEFFAGNAITADSTDAIKVYAWEGMKPLEYGTDLRTLDKNAFLSDLSIGDYDVNVDNQNKKIYVNASGDISSAQISNIKVSDKATYTVAEDNSSITVTSEDGLSVNKFDVVMSDGIYIDFEDDTIGEAPAGWVIDERENCTEAVVADPFDSTNKVFMLDDKNIAAGNNGKIGARYDFSAIKAPYTVSYKIMYDRDGVYADDGASATGTWLHVRNSGKNIMAVGSQDIGTEVRYNVQHGLNEDGTGSLSYMSQKGFPNKTWHEITMVCMSEDEAKFYVDGELLYESAPTFFMDVTRLHFFSSTTRTSKTYIDDILVRSMKSELKKISFTDGTNEIGGIIRDGKVYVNTSDLSKLSMASYAASAGGAAAYENGVVTVTSPDGQSAEYKVCAFEGVALDFESTEAGSAPSGWSLSGMTDSTATVEADPEDVANKVFKIDDQHTGTAKIGAQYNFTAIDAPFSVSYKVMYERADEYSDTGASITGTWMHIRNAGTDIVSVGSGENGSSQKFAAKFKESENKDSLITLGKWHEVEMAVLSESEAYFYVDGVLIHTGSPINYLAASRLNYFSSTTRTSTVYFDDIIVRPYYLEPCEIETVSFTDGTNVIGGIIRGGKIYVNTSDLSKLSIDSCVASAGCATSYADGVVTVTSAEGQSAEYKVCAFEGVAIDFESDAMGAAPAGWSVGGIKFKDGDTEIVTESTATVEADPNNASNKVFKLDDKYLGSQNSGKLSAQYNFTAVKAPFSVSYKVMFERDDKYSSTGASIAGTLMHARNAGKDIAAFGSSDNGTSQYFAARCTTNNVTKEYTTTSPINLGKWHEVELVVLDDTQALFYVDGVLAYTGVPVNYLDVSRLNYFSSTTRMSTVYFDDIIVRPYYLEPCKIETVSFTDGENTVDSYIHENTVFVNAEALDGISISECTISENCTYTYDNGVIAVSSAEGQTVNYSVKAQQYFNDDYESYIEGDFEDSTYYDVNLEAAKAGGTISAAIVKEEGNKILVLTDTDGDGTVGARSMVNIKDMPAKGASKFIVDFDVRYSYVSSDAEFSAINSLESLITEARDSTNKIYLASVRTGGVDTSDSTNQTYKYRVMSDANKYPEVSTVEADEWYNVKIVYSPNADSSAATADYYVDGKLISTNNITNVSTIGRVFLSTSTFRHAVLSYDNFKIISLD